MKKEEVVKPGKSINLKRSEKGGRQKGEKS
jgi:hypothetical protein